MKAKDRKDNVTSGAQLKEDILYVIDTIEAVVGSTLGAGGSLVLAVNPYFGKPSLSKDGIHALSSIEFRDTRYDMIHQIFVEAINKTASQAGDGRTTSTIIACDLIRKGLNDFNPLDKDSVEKLIDDAVSKVKAEIVHITEEERQPIAEENLYLGTNPKDKDDEGLTDVNKNIYDIAMVSSNGDTAIATAVASAMERVGITGLVTANLGQTERLEIEYADGLIFHSGYVQQVFATNLETMVTEFENPLYFVSKEKLDDPAAFRNVVITSVNLGRPLVVMAQKFSRAFVQQMAELRVEDNLPIVLIEPYKYAERTLFWLEDMGVSLNATVFDEVTNKLAHFKPDDLGSSDSIIVKSTSTSISNPHTDGEVLESYRKKLEALADQERSTFNREKIKERIAHLTGALALISVGAESETLAMERVARTEDALNSCLHASKHGYVLGGGAALYRAGITKPLETVLANAEAGDKEEAIKAIVKAGKGYDVNTAEESTAIIDSSMTVINGLNNAKAIAKAILSTKFILDLPDADREKQK